MSLQRNYYDILGVPRTASLEEIKKRYRVLAREHHPDVNRDKPDTTKFFAEITEAYKKLSHPEDRASYDSELALREQRAAIGAARAAAGGFSKSGMMSQSTVRPTAPPRSAPNTPPS